MKLCQNGIFRNITGVKIRRLRKKRHLSQKKLAQQLQLQGMDCSDLTILRIEKGKRFVTDYEVKMFASYFGISADELLSD